MSLPVRASQLGMIGCHACGLVCRPSSPAEQDAGPQAAETKHCPRCESALHARRPNSMVRAWALLIASLIFYIPANLLPVMRTTLLGSQSESTILSGVVMFWNAGSYGIASVIFIASVVVPCTKFLAIGMLLVTTGRHSVSAMRERTVLYRAVELIGYWSMLDVLVVAIICALVRFGPLSEIEPRAGILFFGMVVILTMLSAMSFDPRLIWDAERA
ncbi:MULTISPECIES: paraquat-inducible protein A [Burkholderia cepacia complex]|uniref:paraquat-inducible protein A n=1 Tax=Burkholderia cepacia complex TaxID=87882 RepID=UPI000F57CD41|nr:MULTISPECIES: paraquat-inducible protein A [Burkholderia cepacia complex]RQQ48842.1 paraquat-inducible protein A [Burkholderia stagnalis]RQT57666.1 paraquat-inducible protein A [Burkholderia cepacia]RQX99696.1 paraquat-inducible protein A [Burkholderia stagnalis]RQY14046.1 paraquat-inducible protein A [Burkholderia stagnalis]RQY29274.1 paraquat-inducible protein A [Burkholderia stagnalis]